MKKLPIPSFIKYPCIGAFPCSEHVPSGFGWRDGSEMSTSYLFPLSILAALTLVENGAGVGMSRARVRCKMEHLPCSVVATSIWEVRSGPNILEQKPLESSLSKCWPLQVWALSFPVYGTLVPEGSSHGAGEAETGIWGGWGVHWKGASMPSRGSHSS